MKQLIVGLVAVALVVLALSSGTTTRAGNFTLMVDPTLIGCQSTGHPKYATIHEALEIAAPDDWIYVCPANYNEPALFIADANLTIEGPTPGTATVSFEPAEIGQAGMPLALLTIQSADATVMGIDWDATPAPGFLGTQTIAIDMQENGATINDNVVSGATGTSIQGNYFVSLQNINMGGNEISSANSAITCNCVNSSATDNVIESTTNNGIIGIQILGDVPVITGNTVTRGSILANGTTGTITGNTVVGNNGDGHLISVDGGPYTITDNDLSDTQAPAIYMSSYFTPGGGTLLRNTFTNVLNGVFLEDMDPNDANLMNVTIGGGSPSAANIFTDSGGTLGDANYLLTLMNVSPDQDAENNNWGLCTAAEIEQEILHNSDNGTLGTVDYEPFVASNCPTPTPTPSPTPSPTHTASPTPTPTGSPTATPTASPTASPSGPRIWGDIDCSGVLAALDALKLILGFLELPYDTPPSCPEVLQDVIVSGGQAWGDVDCNSGVEVLDAMAVLATVAGTPLEITGCPVIGEPTGVSTG
jgi:hypothetical protein